MELEPEDFYKTAHMGLAAFLSLKGHTHQTIKMENGQVSWYFRYSDGLQDLVDDFLSRKAEVEPQEYNRCFGEAKKQMYALLDEN